MDELLELELLKMTDRHTLDLYGRDVSPDQVLMHLSVAWWWMLSGSMTMRTSRCPNVEWL